MHLATAIGDAGRQAIQQPGIILRFAIRPLSKRPPGPCAATPSYELCQRIRLKQSVLIVPGAHLGLEGFMRVWLGGKPEFLTEGLRRIGQELRKEQELREESARG